jgi:hypothetical protein
MAQRLIEVHPDHKATFMLERYRYQAGGAHPRKL